MFIKYPPAPSPIIERISTMIKMILISLARIRCHLTGELQYFLNNPVAPPIISKSIENTSPVTEAISVPASSNKTMTKAGTIKSKRIITRHPPISFFIL